jgi:ferredoxin
MAREVFVDADACTGCELCSDTLPAVFIMVDGISVAENSNGAAESAIQDVIDSCPAECIHWK